MSNALDRCREYVADRVTRIGDPLADDLAKLIALADAVRKEYEEYQDVFLTDAICDALDALTQEDKP